MIKTVLSLFLSVLLLTPLHAEELKLQQVAQYVWAIVGRSRIGALKTWGITLPLALWLHPQESY